MQKRWEKTGSWKKEGTRKWYEKHREEILARGRLKWKEDAALREKRMTQKKRYFKRADGIYAYLKHAAKKRGKRFSFSKEQFQKWWDQQKKICHYCNRDNGLERFQIDRKDNDKGYIFGNIVLACKVCNTVKGKIFTYEEMKEIAQKYISKKQIHYRQRH